MAKQIKITIVNDNGTIKFDPSIQQAEAGDQIFWFNSDNSPHWPGKADNQSFFMTNQIAPNDTSSIFSPAVASTIDYIDTLPGASDQGQIVVSGEV